MNRSFQDWWRSYRDKASSSDIINMQCAWNAAIDYALQCVKNLQESDFSGSDTEAMRVIELDIEQGKVT